MITILLSVLCAYLYRAGGDADKPKWLWKARDVGCSLVVLTWLSLNHFIHWSMIFCLALMWGSLSTYFSKKNSDKKWWNYALHGFFIGLSLFPLAIVHEVAFLPILYRSLALGFSIGLYSHFMEEAVWEERGRGALIILTLPLLLIGV